MRRILYAMPTGIALLLALSNAVMGFQAPARAVMLFGSGARAPCTPSRQQWVAPLLRSAKQRGGALGLAATAALDPDVFIKQSEVLSALSMVEDPSRGATVTSLGAVKDLKVEKSTGAVSFKLELGAPDLKGTVKEKSEEFVSTLPWVTSVRYATGVLACPSRRMARSTLARFHRTLVSFAGTDCSVRLTVSQW
jgi:metal-sulfur cluster biosynthetic enzyme